MSQFKSVQDYSNRTAGKGFQMTFANGNTISVMYGVGNYCDNRNRLSMEESCTISPDAEIAIWNKKGDWYDFGDDTVKGYLTTDEVAEFIQLAATTQF